MRGIAEHLHADDGFGLFRNIAFNILDSHIEAARITVNKDGGRPHIDDAIGGCDEAESGGDNLVARSHAECQQREMKSRRA